MEFVLEIPYGTRDFLPEEAAKKRSIESRIADTFASWGYDEVVTPTIEYLDTLTMGNGSALEPHMFKLFDRNNRTLALRHEMTTPIARVLASRLQDARLPLKLSYISSVYRYEQTQTGRQCEFYQAGVELVGSAKATADAEVIALAISIMKEAGLKDFQVCLGQVDFINGIMQQCCLLSKEQTRLKNAIEKRDMVELYRLVDECELSDSCKSMIKEIPMLHGSKDVLKRAYEMAGNEQSRNALDNLSEIYKLLEAYGEFHRLGYAHSFEAFDQEGRLAGGLYGVVMGKVFCGESMFFRVSGASKAAFCAAVERMAAAGIVLIDTQMVTNLTASFGAREISRGEYLLWLENLRGDAPTPGLFSQA